MPKRWKVEMMVRRFFLGVCALLVGVAGSAQEMRTISLEDLENRLRGGLAGQVVGVTYGFPTEFRALGVTYDKEIRWKPNWVRGALNQDDLYVEMTFAEVMDKVGLNATTEQYGDAFRDSEYSLWHANAAARRHLNNGIKAPMSGHPKYNMHANDIDFQIEADFIGLMTPGLPNETIKYCDRVGRVMNYGDGLYGGMFVCGMYSAAFFEADPKKIVEAGIACMPKGSGYRAIIEDVVAEYEAQQDDWRACWSNITAKWDKHDSCPDGALNAFNIDASLNGAFIAIGLLYGAGDFDKTLEISTRCGQDSDCNPASAAGVLGVVLGYDALAAKWVGEIPNMADKKFRYTDYTFEEFIDSTMKRTIAVVESVGGKLEDGQLHIPVQEATPPELEQWSMGIPKRFYRSDDTAWSWSGDWVEGVSRSGGNEVSITVEGTAIAIVGRLTQDGGRAEVYLDGKKAGEIDAYIMKNTSDNDLWHVYGLEDGSHTVRIVTLDESNPKSEGNAVPIQGAIAFRASEN